MLKHLPATTHARLPWPHEAVTTISQGVEPTGANDMQLLGQNGAGLKIGIIDLQFSNYSASIANGELPSNTIITDYTGNGTSGGSHGTNVAEIVHDMAPGAQLYLARIDSETQLQQAVSDMIASGVKVINHSVAWLGAAFYDGTGTLCEVTKFAEAAGILWMNAAGNYRDKHYLGVFSDTDTDLRHEFAAGQNYNTINLTSEQPVTLIMNWDDYPATTTDYDLFLYDGNPDAGGTLVPSSTNNQANGPLSFPYPYEDLVYKATKTGTHYIVVTKKSNSTADYRLTLFSFESSFGVKTRTSSLSQPADCASVLATGATNLSDNPESFSSEGPTTDGRDKPEISAPDRVATSLSSGFAGTSAASPHTAGAAALVMAAHPGFTTTQVRDELMATAYDLSATGFDFRTGYGRISLDGDADGLNHDDDNCALVANLDQLDTDSDGMENTAGYNPLLATSYPIWGDINDDRVVNTADVLLASRAVLGLAPLSDPELARGKVAPLVNGTPRPAINDPFNAADLLLIERKALGVINY